jgi:hypothetical protein
LLPDPAGDGAFRDALERIGAEPVVHSIDGPILRRFVTGGCLSPAEQPIQVRSIDDVGWFSTRRARSDKAPPGEPYFPFVDRPERGDLAGAIDTAVAGDGPGSSCCPAPPRRASHGSPPR